MRSPFILLGVGAILLKLTSSIALPGLDTVTVLPRDNEDGDDGFAPDNFKVCDYTVSFDTLFDLGAAITASDLVTPITSPVKFEGTKRSDCIAAYALKSLITMLDKAYNNYTMVNDGYDEEFDFYVTFMEKTVAFALDNTFMFNTKDETSTENIAPLGPGMKCEDLLLSS